MNSSDLASSAHAEIIKATPAVGVSGATLLGVSLPDIVLYMTLIYTTLSIISWIRTHLYLPWKEKRNGRD
jgi:hypothetical protein